MTDVEDETNMLTCFTYGEISTVIFPFHLQRSHVNMTVSRRRMGYFLC